MQVTLPDGSALELQDGATGADAARAIGEGLARAALAVRQNGEVRDLSARLEDGAPLEIVTPKSPEALELIRHDAAHVLATAVVELYPGTKVSIGPPIAYMLVVGDREMEGERVAVRRHREGDIGEMSVADFAARAEREIVDRTAPTDAEKTS